MRQIRADQKGASDIDPARIDPVGHAGQHQDGRGIACKIDAPDPPGLGVGQTPFDEEIRQQRGEGGKAQDAQHMGRAKGGDDAPALELHAARHCPARPA